MEEKVAMCHAQSKFSTPGVARLGIPELWYSDGPHGVRSEINWDDWGYANWTNDSVTAFPVLTALASTFNPALATEYGNAIAEEALYRGKNVMLGPGVNIYRTPLNGRNFEYMGEDPYLSGTMAAHYIRGLQSRGVACSVKHFVLNDQETARDAAGAAAYTELMAASLGLGCLYSGYFPACAAGSREIHEMLGLKDSEQVVRCLVLGWPDIRFRRTAPRKTPDLTRI